MSPPFDYNHREVNHHVTLWELSGQPDALGWGNMLAAAHRFLVQHELRGKRTGIIIDPSELVAIDAGLRREAGQWRAEHMALIANVVPCACYVAKSAWLRGAITAIFWFAPPVIPVGVKASRREAMHWIEAELSGRVSAAASR
jgi:hypothetical protein